MAARLVAPSPHSFPIQHGMLRVGGATLDADSTREAHDVIVDGRGELSAVVLSLVGESDGVGVYGALAVARDALLSRAPFYEVVSALKAWSATDGQHVAVAATLLRFAQMESRVEMLIAGAPPVACMLPGGRVAIHGALSAAIGAHPREVHPYELLPMVWGSVWFASSPRLLGAARDSDSVRDHWLELALDQPVASLAGLSEEVLLPLARDLSGLSSRAHEGSLLVVHADPTRRFESGIR